MNQSLTTGKMHDRVLSVVFAIVVIAWIMLAPIANAQPGDPVQSNLVVYKVVTNQDNEEVLEPADQVKPGDIVEYHLAYTNTLTSGISNLKPELPVPSGMTFLGNPSSQNLVGASLQENGAISKLPLFTESTLPNGKVVKAEVTADKFKKLQWQVSQLGAGQTITIKARMRVNTITDMR